MTPSGPSSSGASTTTPQESHQTAPLTAAEPTTETLMVSQLVHMSNVIEQISHKLVALDTRIKTLEAKQNAELETTQQWRDAIARFGERARKAIQKSQQEYRQSYSPKSIN